MLQKALSLGAVPRDQSKSDYWINKATGTVVQAGRNTRSAK
ncbi:MAG: hypothetical protein U0Z44_07980 [Kouleothrix sp.]